MLNVNTLKIRLILLMTLNEMVCSSYGLPRSGAGEVVANKNGVSGAALEPTCEQLKAMWRFSKRQSRAAEITNEIPMYRDPFVNNIWKPYYAYATSRSIGGQRLRTPVIGRIIHKPPFLQQIRNPSERHKAFEEFTRLYGLPPKPMESSRSKVRTFRGHLPSLDFPPQQGSFQHLKELIKTERARELQQQRATEEAAARAAALKDLSSDQRNHGSTSMYDSYDYISDEGETSDESQDGLVGIKEGVIPFPDLLAPAARGPGSSNFARFNPYTRSAGRSIPQRQQYDDYFNDGFSGYLP